ncbi:MAG: hypothetical protein KA734_11435 [Fluviicola sp.]|nr:hypothetical protein [Fluviicola sp.]
MSYIILGILIVGGLVYYLTTRNNKGDNQQSKVDPKNNPYNDLRNMALGATAEQLQLKLSDDKTEIYGVVMDWDVGEGTATLVSFTTGDASLYLSSGGGFIGGGGHDNVLNAINCFINKSGSYLDRASKIETTILPDKNGLTFYFLTNKGKFKATEQMQNIESGKSQWLDLFEEANKLITEIRIVSEKQD